MMRYGVAPAALLVLLFSCAPKTEDPAARKGSAAEAATAGTPAATRGTTAKPAAKPAKQADPAFRYSLLKHDTPQQMQADSTTIVALRVKNTSKRAWAAKGPVKIGYYWIDAQGTRLPKPQGRGLVRKDTPPDSTVGIRCRVKAPPARGEHTLVLDMIEDKTWFGSKGAERTRIPVKII